MKIETRKAGCKVLAWLVADIEDIEVIDVEEGQRYLYSAQTANLYSPATHWEHGGPLIEKYKIDLEFHEGEPGAYAFIWDSGKFTHAEGPTPLIAAMTCLVVHKLGLEVEVPDALIS